MSIEEFVAKMGRYSGVLDKLQGICVLLAEVGLISLGVLIIIESFSKTEAVKKKYSVKVYSLCIGTLFCAIVSYTFWLCGDTIFLNAWDVYREECGGDLSTELVRGVALAVERLGFQWQMTIFTIVSLLFFLYGAVCIFGKAIKQYRKAEELPHKSLCAVTGSSVLEEESEDNTEIKKKSQSEETSCGEAEEE